MILFPLDNGLLIFAVIVTLLSELPVNFPNVQSHACNLPGINVTKGGDICAIFGNTVELNWYWIDDGGFFIDVILNVIFEKNGIGFIIVITLLVLFIEYCVPILNGVGLEFWKIWSDIDDMSDFYGNVIVISVLAVLSGNVYVNVYVVSAFIV